MKKAEVYRNDNKVNDNVLNYKRFNLFSFKRST